MWEISQVRCSTAPPLLLLHSTVAAQNIGPLEIVCWVKSGFLLGS